MTKEAASIFVAILERKFGRPMVEIDFFECCRHMAHLALSLELLVRVLALFRRVYNTHGYDHEKRQRNVAYG